MREVASVKPDEIRHDVESARAKLTELIHEPELCDHEDIAQALAGLSVDLARASASVDRAQPTDGIDDMLRLDIAELKDALPRTDEALKRPIQDVVASVTYIERRMKALESERAAARSRSAFQPVAA
jgi:hypothetical protein